MKKLDKATLASIVGGQASGTSCPDYTPLVPSNCFAPDITDTSGMDIG